MRAAVLLRRRDMEHFKATIAIKVDADTTTALGSVFKRDPKDDDIWYNPETDPPTTNRLQKYDTNNLGQINLQSLFDVTLTVLLKGAVREA